LTTSTARNLTLDLSKTKPLTLDAYETPTIADLAPVIDGKPDVTKLTSIDVEKLGKNSACSASSSSSAPSLRFDENPIGKPIAIPSCAGHSPHRKVFDPAVKIVFLRRSSARTSPSPHTLHLEHDEDRPAPREANPF